MTPLLALVGDTAPSPYVNPRRCATGCCTSTPSSLAAAGGDGSACPRSDQLEGARADLRQLVEHVHVNG